MTRNQCDLLKKTNWSIFEKHTQKAQQRAEEARSLWLEREAALQGQKARLELARQRQAERLERVDKLADEARKLEEEQRAESCPASGEYNFLLRESGSKRANFRARVSRRPPRFSIQFGYPLDTRPHFDVDFSPVHWLNGLAETSWGERPSVHCCCRTRLIKIYR